MGRRSTRPLRSVGTLADLGFNVSLTSEIPLALLALLAARLIQSDTRRRFGGAPLLQAAGAAMIGALVVGLHCPLDSLTHLSTHALGAGVVVVLLRRAVVGE